MDAMPSPAFPSGNDPSLLPQVARWNWGAFFLNWIWAFAHRLPVWGVIGLITQFIFPGGLVVAIYLGVKGSELAWEQRPFRDVAEFQATERVWGWWGLGLFLLDVLFVGAILVVILMPLLTRALHSGLPF
ncbi:MAG TPA: hypothetical protein VM221_14435 [Armatimonadota bacterium]|nr:hypothetical protein [Armatimonadota bacterium]